MDTIGIALDDGSEWNNHISLVLNGERVPGTFDVFELIASQYAKKTLCEIMTCSCGVAGCAGIFDGTTVKLRRNTVEWRDIDCGLPKKFYSFTRSNYFETIEAVVIELYDIAKLREISFKPVPEDDILDDYYDTFYNFYTVNDLERILKRIKEYTIMRSCRNW